MHPFRRAGHAIGAVLLLGSLAVANAAGLPAEAFPKPDRPVAEIISPTWASEKERDAYDEAGQLARLLGIGPGTRVADLGAGSGYHAARLSRLVGPTGRVVAQDVVPTYLATLRERVAREKLGNVDVVEGLAHDPRLEPGSVDAAILVHMYHEIEQPFGFLYNLAPALRPGARVGIVDLDRRTENHGTPRDLLRCEVEAVGYRQVAFHKLRGDPAYVAVFELPASGALTQPSAIRACSSGPRR